MKYKILAFDLDGTLTNSDKIVTPKTKDAIYRARELGATIVLASGRPVYGIMPIAKALELDTLGGYILACNGGCVVDCRNMEVIYDKKVPVEYIAGICKFAVDHDYALLTYEGDAVITNKPENEFVQIEANINHLPIIKIDDMATHITFPINKFLITEDPATVEKELPVVQKLFPELNVFTSAPFFMEIVPPNIDKADTLEFLCEKLGTTMEYLAAFGDGGNDVGMLTRAGLGVAMENANDACKAAANYITANNDEDGCGLAIEKMLNNEL